MKAATGAKTIRTIARIRTFLRSAILDRIPRERATRVSTQGWRLISVSALP